MSYCYNEETSLFKNNNENTNNYHLDHKWFDPSTSPPNSFLLRLTERIKKERVLEEESIHQERVLKQSTHQERVLKQSTQRKK
jgi:hypothetical protein